MSQVHDGEGNPLGRALSVLAKDDAHEKLLAAACLWASGEWVKPTTGTLPEPGTYRVRGGAFYKRDRVFVDGNRKPSQYGFCIWLGAEGSWPVFVLEAEREGVEMWSQPDPEVEP